MHLRKRSDVTKVIFVLVTIFFIAVSFLVLSYVMNIFQVDVIGSTALNDTSVAESITNQLGIISTQTIPNGFIVFFGFLVLGSLISAFLIRIHPIFAFLYIIFTGIAVFLGVILGNAYQQISEVEQFAGVLSSHSATTWVMQNITVITVAFGILSMVVALSKIFGRGAGDPL